jgi:hypothetical protein
VGDRWLRLVRFAIFFAFAVACGLAVHRFRRTPEQVALTRYVELELPGLRMSERLVEERIDRLGQAPGLPPAEARALLVDDVIPRLVRLRKQADALTHDTPETMRLSEEYLAVTDRLIDACRTCVRVIDDPHLSTGGGLKEVRRHFAEVRAAYQTWEEHLAAACRRHRLAKPPSNHP